MEKIMWDYNAPILVVARFEPGTQDGIHAEIFGDELRKLKALHSKVARHPAVEVATYATIHKEQDLFLAVGSRLVAYETGALPARDRLIFTLAPIGIEVQLSSPTHVYAAADRVGDIWSTSVLSAGKKK